MFKHYHIVSATRRGLPPNQQPNQSYEILL